MNEYLRALPEIDDDNREFWESCKQHEMKLQKCARCSAFRYYPSPVCPECSSFDAEWTRVQGTGTIYTFSIVQRPPTPAWMDAVPYVYAVVNLEEGPMMPTNIIGCPVDEVRIDMKVEVVYDDVTPEVTLPKFRPVL